MPVSTVWIRCPFVHHKWLIVSGFLIGGRTEKTAIPCQLADGRMAHLEIPAARRAELAGAITIKVCGHGLPDGVPAVLRVRFPLDVFSSVELDGPDATIRMRS